MEDNFLGEQARAAGGAVRRDRALIVLMTLAEVRALGVMHGDNVEWYASAASGVVAGTPHWRAYQNRLLGPVLVAVLQRLLGGSYRLWYEIVAAFLLLAINIVCYETFRRVTKNRRLSLCYACAGVLLFLLFQDYIWLYLWDYWDVFFFTLFVAAVFTGERPSFFVLLFLGELLNREAALFLSAWLVLDAFAPSSRLPGRLRLQKPGQLALGLALTAGGALWTKWIRDHLFRHSMLPEVGLDLAHRSLGQMIPLDQDWSVMTQYLAKPVPALTLMLPLFFLALPVVLLRLRSRWDERTGKLTILLIVMLTMTALFAIVFETRVYLVFIPFLLWLHWSLFVRFTGPAVTTGDSAHMASRPGKV